MVLLPVALGNTARGETAAADAHELIAPQPVPPGNWLVRQVFSAAALHEPAPTGASAADTSHAFIDPWGIWRAI